MTEENQNQPPAPAPAPLETAGSAAPPDQRRRRPRRRYPRRRFYDRGPSNDNFGGGDYNNSAGSRESSGDVALEGEDRQLLPEGEGADQTPREPEFGDGVI